MSGLLFPNLLHATGTELHENVSQLWLSRFAAVLMLVTYAAFIYFQVATHSHLFDSPADDDEDEQPVLGFWGSIFWLAVISALISVLSDYLVNSVDGTATLWQVPVSGLCVIVLPLVNNVTGEQSLTHRDA